MMMCGWWHVGRKFSKVGLGGKNSHAKRQDYLTLTHGPLVNVIKILDFVAPSSNMITGVWSNVMNFAR